MQIAIRRMTYVASAMAILMLVSIVSHAARAEPVSFSFSGGDISATGSLDVIGGQAVSGTGDVTSSFWAGSDPMTLVTLSTPLVHDLGGGNLSYRFGGGTDLIGDTAYPVDGGGLVFIVATNPNLDVGFNLWWNGGNSYTGFLAGNSLTPGGPIIYDGANGGANFSVSATPLPATWTLMLLGLAGLGFLAYRRQLRNLAPTVA